MNNTERREAKRLHNRISSFQDDLKVGALLVRETIMEVVQI